MPAASDQVRATLRVAVSRRIEPEVAKLLPARNTTESWNPSFTGRTTRPDADEVRASARTATADDTRAGESPAPFLATTDTRYTPGVRLKDRCSADVVSWLTTVPPSVTVTRYELAAPPPADAGQVARSTRGAGLETETEATAAGMPPLVRTAAGSLATLPAVLVKTARYHVVLSVAVGAVPTYVAPVAPAMSVQGPPAAFDTCHLTVGCGSPEAAACSSNPVPGWTS